MMNQSANDIMYSDILPSIAKAICLINQQVMCGKLKTDLRKSDTDLLRKKAQTMNDVISKFISEQVSAAEKTFNYLTYE